MNSIQQPEEEFLGIVLGVPLELESAPGHHVLPNKRTNKSFVLKLYLFIFFAVAMSRLLLLPSTPTTSSLPPTTTFMKYSAGLTRMTVISTIGKVSKGGWGEREPKARRKLFKTREGDGAEEPTA